MPFADLAAADGVELWSFVTDTVEQLGGVRDGAAVRRLARAACSTTRRERNMRAWDALCAARRVPAIGGLDAHQIGVRIGGRVPVQADGLPALVPPAAYACAVREEPSSRTRSDEALREGRAYLAVDALAPARGFRFWARRPGGRSGDGRRGAGRPLQAPRRAAAPARLRMLRDGEEVAAREAPALVIDVDGPGVYRVEARLERHGRERTWVVSNPIYFR